MVPSLDRDLTIYVALTEHPRATKTGVNIAAFLYQETSLCAWYNGDY